MNVSDQFLNSEDKEMLTAVRGVIKAVLDGVKVRAGPGGLSGDLQLPHCRLLVSQELVPKLLNVGVNVFRCLLLGATLSHSCFCLSGTHALTAISPLVDWAHG